MSSIQEHRSFYANLVVKTAGASDERLIAAFASVERERYVGGGPWSVLVNSSYIPTEISDPRILYQDIVIGLATERNINNGQPTLHARCLVACAPSVGNTIVHIGAGTGYYTAILDALVGSAGHVFAYEIEPDIANKARENLRHLSNVEVIAASASEGALPNADIIYVNAGATRPLATWLDALKVGGRLIFPLTPNQGWGVMLLVTRLTPEHYAARPLVPVQFIPCIGARDNAESEILAKTIQSRAIFAANSLHRGATPDSTACCVGKDWWLSTSAAT